MRRATAALALLVVAVPAALAHATTPRRPQPHVVAPAIAAAAPRVEHVRFGTSVRGRALTATAFGEPDAAHAVVVVGVIHGNETAGLAVLRQLAATVGTTGVPAGTRLWLVDAANPDGRAAGGRHDARGVDLNRNFPWRWRASDDAGGNARRGDTYYPGPRAASEPETRAMVAFLERVHPDVTIWYHQHLDLVEPRGHDLAVPRAYARATGMRTRVLPRYHGTATGWENHAIAGSTSFVVELPPGALPARDVARHARAVLAALRNLAATS